MDMLLVVEIVSFLYAILMNAGNAQSSSPTLPEATINLITEALCMLNFMGIVDLKVLQVSDGTKIIRRCLHGTTPEPFQTGLDRLLFTWNHLELAQGPVSRKTR